MVSKPQKLFALKKSYWEYIQTTESTFYQSLIEKKSLDDELNSQLKKILENFTDNFKKLS